MKKAYLLFFLLICFLSKVSAQQISGSLLVVGGGSESIGGWSDLPYSWAVNQSENKRVAIIGTSNDVSNWLPNYFMDHCGAVFAKNFVIPNSNAANSKATYDSLLTYDFLFFRGGNQYNYYKNYRNTLTQEAVEEVFLSGGVVGGTSAGLHILSGILFTARYGTVYPDEALEDPYNQYMTLADDFLQLAPGLLFDSHFAERGRFGRLIGMLGRWDLDGHDKIIGIGVDDKTALCITPDLNVTVFGTGAANFYRQRSGNEFSLSGQKLLATNLEAMQLLNECTLNLQTFEYSGLSQTIEPWSLGEVYYGHLWLSGSDKIAHNTEMLDQVASWTSENDSLLIITGTDIGLAESIAIYLESQGIKSLIMQAIPANGNDNLLKNSIYNIHRYVFAANDYLPLMDFLKGTSNGMQMLELMQSGDKALAFVGGDSRYAGKTVLKNYDQVYASYDGLLEYREGIGLLHNTIVMPNTFSEDVDVENTATGLPYGMVLDGLRYGLWINGNSFAHYRPNGSAIELTSFGDFPMILVENSGTLGDLCDQSAVSSGKPRNIAGFGSFTFRLMDQTTSMMIDYVGNTQTHYNSEHFRVFPNPASDRIRIDAKDINEFKLYLASLDGRILFEDLITASETIFIEDIPAGVYLLSIRNKTGNLLSTQKLIIR